MTFDELITEIKADIYQNKSELITGAVLQSVLVDIVNYVNDNYSLTSEVIDAVQGITFSDGSSILKGDDDKWHLIIDDIEINSKKIADIIRSTDTAEASDINIFSALESLSKFLRADAASTANEIVTFLKGINFSDGTKIYKDTDGWHLSIATIEAQKLIVDELDSKTTTNINGKSISDIIRSTDDTSPSDTNVYSAKATDEKILAIIEKSTDSLDLSDVKVISAAKANTIFSRKDIADSFAEDMTFAKGINVAGMMKAAAATIVGIATIGTVNATTLNADAGTIPTLNATTATISQSLKAGSAQITADIAIGGTTTTLNAVVNNLATTYQLSVSDTATILRTIVKDYISSDTYIPGFSGSGFKLWNNGAWNLELDTLTVRKVMNIFELIINKIRSVNGGLIVSPGNGKISSVSLADSVYTLGIEGDMTFVANDLVRCQTFRTTGSKYYWVQVQSVTGNNITVNQSDFGTAVPEVGDELVQMGNTTNSSRQGYLYLVANEDGKPRIEALNGINSTDLTGKAKAVFGDLDGITDTDFTSISGYGLYAENVYLKGSFILKSGKTIETAISDAIDGSSQTYVTQSTYSTEIKALTDSISAKVSQTDFNSLGDVVSGHTSTLSQLSDTIDARITTQVSSGGSIYNAVAASFTMSDNGISLFGKTINITGATIFSSLATQTQAQGYANAAQSNAATDATNKANSVIGLNKWILKKYSYSTAAGMVPTFALINNLIPDFTEEKDDASTFSASPDNSLYDNYIGIVTTYLYCNSDYTYTASNVAHDDGGSIYVNGSLVYSNGSYSSSNSVSLPFKKGWNRIDLLWCEQGGGDNFYINHLFSQDSNITKMAAYPNVDTINPYSIAYSDAALSSAKGYTDSLKSSLGSLAYQGAVSKAMLDTTVINGGYILTSLIKASDLVIASGQITGLGSLATASSVSTSQITGLGGLALKDTIGKAQLDSTIISGAYISTSLLNVQEIVANGIYAQTINAGNATFSNITMTSATVTGTINANAGTVGGFTINSNSLTASTIYAISSSLSASITLKLSNQNISFTDDTSSTYACLGTQLQYTPSQLEVYQQSIVTATLKATCTTKSSYYDNTALYIEASGANNNHAIFSKSGDYAGFRLNTRTSAGGIIGYYDNIIIDTSTTYDATYTLPSGDQNGHLVIIITNSSRMVYIQAQTPMQYGTSYKTAGNSVHESECSMVFCVYNANNSIWQCRAVTQ